VWNRVRWIPKPMRRALGASMLSFTSTQWSTLLRPVAPLFGITQVGEKVPKLADRMTSADDMYGLFLSLVTGWRNSAQVVLDAPEPISLLSDRTAWPALQHPVSQMMALDALTYLPDDILTKVDRASMSESLEARAPFLDHRVVAFALSLPMHMKIRAGTGKWLLRQVLYRYVPKSLVERPKMGFAVPIDTWLRGPLREWVEDLLEPSSLRKQGYLDSDAVQSVWRAHMNGASNGPRLWSVLMFQSWLIETSNSRKLRAPLAA
jgi:asparagine synthase (glutamine-hydrolysing)